MSKADSERWEKTVRALPEAKQASVELELAQVSELADPDSIAHLTAAARGQLLPPVSVPGDAARSLWFFLWHPQTFREVLLGREIADVDAWRTALGPSGIATEHLPGRQSDLAATLREFFRWYDDSGLYCVVDAFPIAAGVCFVAYLSDRLQLLDVFTDDGELMTRTARPSVTLIFLYEPATGRILVRTRLRSHDRIRDLVRRFGSSVLGVELPDNCLQPMYRLDMLKHRFDPPADRPDMEGVRVKSLHLTYPERIGRRRVKLETLAGDDSRAIDELLHQHASGDRALDDLDVVYAEVEVSLRIGNRRKPYVIRLWPDRTSLSHTPLGQRFQSCLRRWGLTHAG